MNIKEHERIDNAMKYGKRISNDFKKKLIPIESLPNAELRISNDDGWTISGHIKYNHHRINFTYYRWLPEYSENDPVKVTKRVIIHDWYYFDSYNKSEALDFEKQVSDEIIQIFDNLLLKAA